MWGVARVDNDVAIGRDGGVRASCIHHTWLKARREEGYRRRGQRRQQKEMSIFFLKKKSHFEKHVDDVK